MIIVTNAEIYIQFGKRLALLRQDKGMSQNELAKLLGIPQSTYAGYEIGKRKISLGLIKQLADFFTVSPTFLITGEDTPNSQMQVIESNQRTQKEQTLIKKYRALDERGKILIDNIINTQLEAIYPKAEDDAG